MKIAILGAMVEEITPILARVQVQQEHDIGHNRYYEARYRNLELVIAYSKIGKVNAALSASVMFLHFGAQKLIFSGVAGGIAANLKVGDLVIADKLCQHDVDITAFGHPFGFIPETTLFYEADSELNALAINAAKSQNLRFQIGTVATGDQFVASSERKNWVAKQFDAIALEMEGAAVAAVCAALGKPFCVLRAISDAADADANFSFDSFLEKSAHESADLLFLMLEQM
ncbi:MAG: 5'-methylthioadenosine/adenosylhomocysteine nucleosidase [Helicobacter sp.]|nr:5'-methylthioadenosine/adenosylhomocysteine nucleosidase [Helicobacter sp.]